MKLELKHLAPYLPYGLKCSYRGGNVSELSFDYLSDFGCDYFKPILRPLSDLLKEGLYIGHLNIETITDESYPVDYEEDNIKDLDVYLENWIESKSNDYHVNFLPHGLVNELISEHFDVFGLINNGLAIDINTL